ncbi:MAG: hypothetical protein Q7S13_02520 [Candidatus Omnitrophota bacterium]|nr:hypothetical protein [Candidatus Omnitrophota bacterium]
MPASRPVAILVIFLIALAITFLLFPEELKQWLSRMSSADLWLMALSIALFYFFSERPFSSRILTSAHVLFQQFMIAMLVFMGPSEKFSRVAWRVLIFFGGSHLLLAVFMPWSWTLLFAISASVAAIAFAYLIQRVKHGIMFSYVIHLGFYLLLFNVI